jgi:DNA-binding response OmpR family regulator
MPKILVVDDEKVSLSLLKFGMKAEAFEVVTARDGLEALEKLNDNQFNLIVLDIMMPNVNGYEFMKELRMRMGENIPPVFILTANDKLEEVFRMEGIKGYFVKPTHLSLLIKEIKACLGLS